MLDNQLSLCDISPFPLRSVIVGGFLLLFLCCFGLFGNCLCLTVLIQKYLGDTIFRVYLYALCIADSLTLVCCMFMLVVPILTDYFQCDSDIQTLVNYFVLFWYPLGTFVESVSTILTATISLVRLLSVRFPLQTRMLKSRQTATSVIALLLMFICLFHIPRLFELHVNYCVTTVNGQNTTLATLAMTSLRKSQLYKTIYMTYSNTTLMFALPFLTILVCNSTTMVLLIQNGTGKSGLRQSGRLQERHKMTTKLLIFLCFSFLFSHSLPFLINALEALEILEMGLKEDTYGWLVDVSNFLVGAKASSNFLLYLMFNKKFRLAVSKAEMRMSLSSTSEKLKQGRSKSLLSY